MFVITACLLLLGPLNRVQDSKHSQCNSLYMSQSPRAWAWAREVGSSTALRRNSGARSPWFQPYHLLAVWPPQVCPEQCAGAGLVWLPRAHSAHPAHSCSVMSPHPSHGISCGGHVCTMEMGPCYKSGFIHAISPHSPELVFNSYQHSPAQHEHLWGSK